MMIEFLFLTQRVALKRTKIVTVIVLFLAAVFDLTRHGMAATVLPTGFTETVFAEGFDTPVSMDFAPDGRLFVCQKGGFGFDWQASGIASVRIVKNGVLLPIPFIQLPVVTVWECGLHGIAFDPDFEENGWVYFSHTINRGAEVVNRIIRVKASVQNPDVADPQSIQVLIDTPAGFYHNGGAIRFGADDKLYYAVGTSGSYDDAQNLSLISGKVLRLNPDGSIPADNPFVGVAQAHPAIWAYGFRQPFTAAVDPVQKGGTGMILINEVGENDVEEVNELKPGKNYGWPMCEGPCNYPQTTSPLWSYSHEEIGSVPTNCTSSAISGGSFYRHTQFPEKYRGNYFISDYAKGWIRALNTQTRQAVNFAVGAENPIDVKVGPDGSLYYLSANISAYEGSGRKIYKISYNQPPSVRYSVTIATENADEIVYQLDASGSSDPEGQSLIFEWLLPDGSNVSGTQTLVPVSRQSSLQVGLKVSDDQGGTTFETVTLGMTPVPEPIRLGVDADSMPATLSQTGVFESLAELKPVEGVIPYEVNTPLWSDGALKRRWIKLPQQGRIRFHAHESWEFPPGTVLIKHFELPPEVTPDNGRSRRLETRFLVRAVNGEFFGVTYRWRPDGLEADLLTTGAHEVLQKAGLPNGQNRGWDYPSRTDCFLCHRKEAGDVLGVNTRQLNGLIHESSATRNQLAMLSDLGMFTEPLPPDTDFELLSRLKNLGDQSATLEDRVKSYLDSNCAHCHQPSTRGVYARFDARYGTDLIDQKLVNGFTMNGRTMGGVDIFKLVIPRVLNEWNMGSILHMRMAAQDRFRMPPLATSIVDTQAVAVVGQWIKSLPVPSPTNSLKTSDLLFQNPSTGEIYLWTQTTNTSTGRKFLKADFRADSTWTVIGLDDFNGDLHQDLLWHNIESGEILAWIVNPAAPAYTGSISFSTVRLGNISPGTQRYFGSGDFDGNGQTDIFWQDNRDGRINVWPNQGGFDTAPLVAEAPFPSHWKPVGVADFNLDGQLDLACVNLTNNQAGVWFMSGLNPVKLRVFDIELSPSASLLGVVDDNGDGQPDLHWEDSDQAEYFVWIIRDMYPVERRSTPYNPTDIKFKILAPSPAKDRLYPMVSRIKRLGGEIMLEWDANQAGNIIIQSKSDLLNPVWDDWQLNLRESDGFSSVPIDLKQQTYFFRILRQNSASSEF